MVVVIVGLVMLVLFVGVLMMSVDSVYLADVSDDKLLCELQERLVAELVAFDNGRSGLSAEYCERLAAVVYAIHDVKELW